MIVLVTFKLLFVWKQFSLSFQMKELVKGCGVYVFGHNKMLLAGITVASETITMIVHMLFTREELARCIKELILSTVYTQVQSIQCNLAMWGKEFCSFPVIRIRCKFGHTYQDKAPSDYMPQLCSFWMLYNDSQSTVAILAWLPLTYLFVSMLSSL